MSTVVKEIDMKTSDSSRVKEKDLMPVPRGSQSSEFLSSRGSDKVNGVAEKNRTRKISGFILTAEQQRQQEERERIRILELELNVIKQKNSSITDKMLSRTFGNTISLSSFILPCKQPDIIPAPVSVQNKRYSQLTLGQDNLLLGNMKSNPSLTSLTKLPKIDDENKANITKQLTLKQLLPCLINSLVLETKIQERKSLVINIKQVDSPGASPAGAFVTSIENEPQKGALRGINRHLADIMPPLIEHDSEQVPEAKKKMESSNLLPSLAYQGITPSETFENLARDFGTSTGTPSPNPKKIKSENEFKRGNGETFYDEKEPQYERVRDFKVKTEQRQFLFEGLKVVQFEPFITKEALMQGIVVRDILKILADKSISFKNYLIDRNKMRKLFLSLSFSTRISANIKFEQIIGYFERISLILAEDLALYKDFPGMGVSPLEEYRKKQEEYYQLHKEIMQQQQNELNEMHQLQLEKQQQSTHENTHTHTRKNAQSKSVIIVPTVQKIIREPVEFIKLPKRYDKRNPYFRPIIDTAKQEPIVFEDNIQVYDKIADYLKEAIDQFRILSRQREYKHLAEPVVEELIKLVTQARYNLSQFGEELRMFEKNNEDKLRWQKFYSSEKLKNERSIRFNKNSSKSVNSILASTASPNGMNSDGMNISIIAQPRQDGNEKLEFIYRLQKLTSLLYNKFNYRRNKFQTRESKVILNQDKFDQEKELLLESNDIEAAKKTQGIADNRKIVALQRLRMQDDVEDKKMKGNQLQGANYFKAFEVHEH